VRKFDLDADYEEMFQTFNKYLGLYKIKFYQIFLSSDRKINIKNDIIQKCKQICKSNNINLVVHASLMINIAKSWNKYSWWINYLIDAIKICYELNIKIIVLHLGLQLELSKQDALDNMMSSLLYIDKVTSKYKNVTIALETSSKQGTEMCYNIDDLAHFYTKLNEKTKRYKICIDTCHVFAAGYAINNEKGIHDFIFQIETKIKINNVVLIHLNDSYHELNSNIDRHANIGYGHIGKNNMKIIMQYFNSYNIPIVLETSYDHLHEDIEFLFQRSTN
jgi:deoxyribonuclease-4